MSIGAFAILMGGITAATERSAQWKPVTSASVASMRARLPLAASEPTGLPDSDANFPYILKFAVTSGQFIGGDNVTITELRGNGPGLAVGNTYLIKGTYTLQSQAVAQVAVYTTTSNYWQNDNGPYGNNSKKISAGTGSFKLMFYIRVEGRQHVSFYPPGRAESFGGVYFTGR